MITWNLEFCFQSENLTLEKNSELSFFGIRQITNDNSELGILLSK